MVIEAFHLLPRRFVSTDNTPPPKLSVMYQEPGAPPPAPGFFVLKDAEASPAVSKLNGQTRFARLVNSSAGQYLAEKGYYADRTMATTVTAKGQVTIPK